MKKDSNFGNKLINGSILVLFITILTSVISYLNRLFYARVLSVDMYGLLYAGLGLFNMFWTYSDLGFAYATTYLLPKYFRSKKYSVVWNIYKYNQVIQTTISIIVALLFSINATYISVNYFKVPGSEGLIYVLGIYLVANSLLSSLIQFFIGAQKEFYYSTIILVRALFVLTFTIILWLLGKSLLVYYALAWALGYLITAGIYLQFLKKKFAVLNKEKLKWDYDIFHKMFKLAIPSILATVMGSLSSSGDLFLLTLLRGVREVGVYNVIYPLASIPLIILSPLGNLLLPLFSHLMEEDKKKVGILIGKLLEAAPLIIVYFSLFIFIFPLPPVNLFFGAKWLGLADKLLGPLSLVYIIASIVNLLGIVVLGLGKAKEKLNITVLVSCLGLPINALLIWRFGVAGTIITYLIISFLSLIFFIRILKRLTSFSIPVGQYIKMIVMSISITLIFRNILTGSFSLITYFIVGIIYTIIYALIIYYLKIVDYKFILQYFKNRNYDK